jgi:polyhydroxyalkanoate synthesis repressor PhaR
MLIKRYPNRKLYETEAKRYITHEHVAELLRQGEEVRVVDYATGEDLTSQVLSQVIAEQEKKRGGFVPRPVLTGLIQAGGATLEVMRRAMLLPLDLLSHVDEEIQRRIEILIQQGELTEAEGMHWLERLLAVGPRLATEAAIEREIRKIIDEQDVPNHEEFERLEGQVDGLAAKLDDIQAQR